MSTTSGSAFPPAASISAAAVWIVPGSLGCGESVLAAMTTLAPSRAARNAIARPMPRLAPEMNNVLPERLGIVASLLFPHAALKGRSSTLPPTIEMPLRQCMKACPRPEDYLRVTDASFRVVYHAQRGSGRILKQGSPTLKHERAAYTDSMSVPRRGSLRQEDWRGLRLELLYLR